MYFIELIKMNATYKMKMPIIVSFCFMVIDEETFPIVMQMLYTMLHIVVIWWTDDVPHILCNYFINIGPIIWLV